MPTRERVRGTIIAISEELAKIGYETRDLVGPINSEGEEVTNEDVREDENYRYYLTGSANKANFYITFSLNREYASVVYPMNVLRHLGSYLDQEEIDSLLDEDIEWGGLDAQVEDRLSQLAARKIVENTDPIQFHRAAFTLSAQASTTLVDYNQSTTEEGFPVEFQCVRGIFPYTKQMSMERLDDRIHPVIIAGERGRRYMEYSFRIEKEDKSPDEYEFQAVL